MSAVPPLENLKKVVADLLLLKTSNSLKEALLYAVALELLNLVHLLVAEMEKIGKNHEKSPCENSATFPPHMTPLMLSCIQNQYDMVALFLARGHTIAVPHDANCSSDTCAKQRDNGEPLEVSLHRIDCYR